MGSQSFDKWCFRGGLLLLSVYLLLLKDSPKKCSLPIEISSTNKMISLSGNGEGHFIPLEMSFENKSDEQISVNVDIKHWYWKKGEAQKTEAPTHSKLSSFIASAKTKRSIRSWKHLAGLLSENIKLKNHFLLKKSHQIWIKILNFITNGSISITRWKLSFIVKGLFLFL